MRNIVLVMENDRLPLFPAEPRTLTTKYIPENTGRWPGGRHPGNHGERGMHGSRHLRETNHSLQATEATIMFTAGVLKR